MSTLRFTSLLVVLTLLLHPVSTFSQGKVTYLKMDRTACFGRCPVYTVELMYNGVIVYNGSKNVEFIGEREAGISPAAMQKFMKQFSRYKLLSLQNVYKPKATDLPRLNFTFTVNGKTKTVKNGESGPAFLDVIGKKVDSLLATIKDWKAAESTNAPELEIGVASDKTAFVMVEQMPEFPGGDKAMLQYLSTQLIYPRPALENNIQGKVICSFTVMDDGSIQDVKVMKGIGFGCDEEAVRVIKSMPKWKPGKQNGRAVNTKFTLPVHFELE
ncbi:MAG TPA: TonB family protein [Chitinophagaceae bacterium]|nr:TonB family protein [Chitinophagaceae bacterium]HNF71981.1 TonB family protein [Chitinophagaceae bacterium]